jgi:hypothetical protein
MSWGAQNWSKDAKTPSVALAMSENPELDLCPVQPYCKAPLTHERAPITSWECQRRWSCDYHLVTRTAMIFFLHI